MCLHNFHLFLPAGCEKWPSGIFLKFTSGDQLGPVNVVSVKPLDSGEYYDLSVNMISPGKTGMYQGQWRMCTPSGQYFGGNQFSFMQYSTLLVYTKLLRNVIKCLFTFLKSF